MWSCCFHPQGALTSTSPVPTGQLHGLTQKYSPNTPPQRQGFGRVTGSRDTTADCRGLGNHNIVYVKNVPKGLIGRQALEGKPLELVEGKSLERPWELEKPQNAVRQAWWKILVRVQRTRMLREMQTIKARFRTFQLETRSPLLWDSKSCYVKLWKNNLSTSCSCPETAGGQIKANSGRSNVKAADGELKLWHGYWRQLLALSASRSRTNTRAE